jgi:predicted Zn finger-like uncharacterized protein
MSSATICPNCQTQFVVTKKQLNQYNGKVRCGHCLHVFDASQQLLEKPEQEVEVNVENEIAPFSTTAHQENLWPTIDINSNETEETNPLIKSIEETLEKTMGTEFEADEDEDFAISETIDYSSINHSYDSHSQEPLLDEPKPPAFEMPSSIVNAKPKVKSAKKSSFWLWLLLTLLLLAAIAQSIYFLRDKIAMYYPSTKPYLQQLCQPIGCTISLPKNIDLITIEDSEMLQDSVHEGIIHLNSVLINQSNFAQAYPNLELTLADEDKKTKLRRTFKPAQYLPERTDIEAGMPPLTEIKVKLSIAAKVDTVSDYQLFLTY